MKEVKSSRINFDGILLGGAVDVTRAQVNCIKRQRKQVSVYHHTRKGSKKEAGLLNINDRPHSRAKIVYGT